MIAPLAVTPSSATTYPGLVTTFLVSGGSGSYVVVSDNQGVVANQAVTGNVFSINPSLVSSETKVNLTIQDGTSSVKVPVTIQTIAVAPLGAQPSTVAFQGTTPGTCASGISGDVLVFGGRPPYVVSQPAAFIVNPSVVSGNPGRLTITSTGQCAPSTAIAIVDTLGASTSVTASNSLSPTPVPTPATFAVAPLAVTLTSCNDVANIVVVGGTGHYIAASGDSSVYANINGLNTGYITRQAKSPAVPATVSPTGPTRATVPVVFSDGATTATVTVTLIAGGLSQCP